jgi:biopolymer transport protein ExbB
MVEPERIPMKLTSLPQSNHSQLSGCHRFVASILFIGAIAISPTTAFAQAQKSTSEKTVAKQTEKKENTSSGFPTSPTKIAQAMGYPFIAAFLIASVIAVWFSIERLVVLRRGRVIPRPFVERFLDHLRQDKLDQPDALKICEDNGSPVAHIFAHGVRKWGKPSVEVEQAIIDGGERQVSQLRKHLRVLNGVATVTPLIGLFGTVIGMIQAFVAIEANAAASGGDPEKIQLAIGIAQALLTTAAGLAIAIPALIIYMFLAGRIDSLVMTMDDLGQHVVHLISAEGLAAPKAKPTVSKTPAPKAIKRRGKQKTASEESSE